MTKHPNKRPITPQRPPDACVAKNSWWYALCPTHGEAQHLSYLGGRCGQCAAAALAAEPEPPRDPRRWR